MEAKARFLDISRMYALWICVTGVASKAAGSVSFMQVLECAAVLHWALLELGCVGGSGANAGVVFAPLSGLVVLVQLLLEGFGERLQTQVVVPSHGKALMLGV